MSTMGIVRTSVRIFAGAIVWAAHFTAIYALTALACARDAADAVRMAIAIATLVAAAVAAAIVVREWRRRAAFEGWLAAAIAALAFVAIAWQAVPMLVLAPCR